MTNARLDVLRKMLEMSMRQASLGVRIKAAREEKRMTQRQVAAQIPGRAGVPVDDQTVSRWERGSHTPDIETLELLAQVLNKPLTYFLADQEELQAPADLVQAAAAIAAAAVQLQQAAEALAESRAGAEPPDKVAPPKSA